MIDVPADILASLVCSKCDQLLKKGPVYQQHDGKAICGLCQGRKDAQLASRCLLYEATAQLLGFPCRYQEEGCPTTVPFVAAGSTEYVHEDACEYRQYVCPVLGSNRCDWTGLRNQLQQHCQQKHPEHVLPNPAQIIPDIRISQTTDYVISAFHSLFLLHTRVDVSTAKLHYAVRLLADPQYASNFSFIVTIRRGDNMSCWSRNVLPQELLALQEHSALNLSINSLLNVLGGWDGVSLSVEVKARGPQAKPVQEQGAHGTQREPEIELTRQRREPKQEQTQCGGCASPTPFLYRGSRGWLCANCAPQKETCHNEGCNFQDIGVKKRDKHSDWFCQRRTKCPNLMCKAVLNRSMLLQQHFATCRWIKKIPATSMFTVKRVNGCQRFLVDTAAGHAVCAIFYTEMHFFSLRVRAPVLCEQLHQYRCEVWLLCAGKIRAHMPDTMYKSHRDWELVFKEDNFFSHPDVRVQLMIDKSE